MDKETLSNYGWVVIAVLVLSIMIALATPFGQYIGNAVKSTTQGLFDVSQKAGAIAGLNLPDQSFEDNGGGSTPAPVPVVGSATFSGYYDEVGDWISETVTLTWDELKLAENGTKYGYDASAISDTEIGDYALYGCTSLTSIDLPESLTSIGESAFQGCDSLTSIKIPDSVTFIGEYSIAWCTSLTSVNISSNSKPTSISYGAFYGCTGLTSVTIGSGVTSIGVSAFGACDGLTSITVDQDNLVYHSSGNCLIETGSKTLLAGCSTSVIPTDGSVTSIGDYVFQNYTSLTSIDLPDNITTIGACAFYYCKSLTRIEIPDNVTSINNRTFQGCINLTSIKIPNSVTSIGIAPFEDCTNLTVINYTGTIAQWGVITKGGWHTNSSITQIICSDGTITL